MVFKVRDRLGFLRPVRSASSASDCGDVRRIVSSSSRFFAVGQACRYEAWSPEPGGRNNISPGREPWVERKKQVESPGDDTEFHHVRLLCRPCRGLGSLINAYPGLTPWAMIVPPYGLVIGGEAAASGPALEGITCVRDLCTCGSQARHGIRELRGGGFVSLRWPHPVCGPGKLFDKSVDSGSDRVALGHYLINSAPGDFPKR